MLIRAGALYNIYYSRWKTNVPAPRIVFVLYSPGVGKLHCLQLSAKQLSIVNRLKLINIISKLSKVPAAQKWNGRILFNIFKQYAPDAVRQCYRTLWVNNIVTYSLINYGLNDPDSMLAEEKAYGDKGLYMQVKNNIIKKTLDMYTARGFKPADGKFAQPIHTTPQPNSKTTMIDPKTPIVDNTKTPTQPAPGATTNKPSPGGTNKPGTINPQGDIEY